MGLGNEEGMQPDTKEGVMATLEGLTDVFARLRMQVESPNEGLLGSRITSITDPDNVMVGAVLDGYVGDLRDPEKRKTEIKFFKGDAQLYDDVVTALIDSDRRSVLLAYYNVQENTPWRIAESAIKNNKSYEESAFPANAVKDVFDNLQKKA